MIAVSSLFLLSPLSSAPDSGAAVSERGNTGRVSEPVSLREQVVDNHVLRSEICRSARTGLAWYRGRESDWLKLRGAIPSDQRARAPRSCPDARYLARVAKARSFHARRAYELYVERHTLHDFPVRAGSRAWLRAVQEAQRAFPGTEAWLLSCSASEGGWGRWVTNSQGSGVGGWLQYQPGTFSSFFRAAHSHVTGRGYRVPRSAASWYSPLGQALAGGWAIRNGMRHHWAGAGC